MNLHCYITCKEVVVQRYYFIFLKFVSRLRRRSLHCQLCLETTMLTVPVQSHFAEIKSLAMPFLLETLILDENKIH